MVPPTQMPGQQPKILFVEGVADDRLVKITIKEAPASQQPGRDEKITVLHRCVLGTLPHYDHVSVPGMGNETLLLVSDKEQTLKFNLPQVIVNCIVDADSTTQTLNKLENLIGRIKATYKINIPVVNPPAAIARTTREKIYEQFSALPGLHIPRTIRITPNGVADAVKQIKAADIKPPFLIRTVGTHGGEGLQQIADWSENELLKLERYPYDGRAFYAIQWVDFKSSDGLYRKTRLVSVGGRPIARHRIVTDDWNIHSRSRKTLMQSREDLRKEEEAFLKNPPEQSISAAAMKSLRKVYEVLGLDYFGIDCNIQDDGSLLIFEMNAACNAMEQDDLHIYPYLNNAVQNVIKAFNDVVANKAKIAQAA